MTWTKTVSISKLQKATNWLSAKCRIIYTFYSIVFGKRQDDHHILTTFFSFLLVSFLNNCSLSIVRVQHVFDDGCIASVFFFFSLLLSLFPEPAKSSNMEKGEFRQSQLEAIITHKPSVKWLILFAFFPFALVMFL